MSTNFTRIFDVRFLRKEKGTNDPDQILVFGQDKKYKNQIFVTFMQATGKSSLNYVSEISEYRF